MLQITQKNHKTRKVKPNTEGFPFDNVSIDLNILEASLITLLENFDTNELLRINSYDMYKLFSHFDAVTKLFDRLLHIKFNNEDQPHETFAFLINKIISERIVDWSTGHNKATQIARTLKEEL